MAERITNADLENKVRFINTTIKGGGNIVKVGRRYGYTAIDLGYEDNPYALKRTLIAGLTRKEALDYLRGIETGIELSRVEERKKLRSVM